ncbi:site-specific DNA-methyltransferase [Nannocystis sp. SCPEA4]|uniref:site-specific DNA-methyltransferase n=1 Tax=Nannocystis sp. SCPEA4 TaxID=2996787 RepID=UPI00226D73BF|nr:site-specific DNA-methyltransferase [Nannocystis sp. SCPEA4]MCY1054944.1 site-specific DNA-methyltransferase [Nannocystis sp. SCPEA4]
MPRRTTPTEARVELTWPGKVAPPAVAVAAEPLVVRERVGEPGAWADRLVWGDNSHALAALHAELGAAVDLVYIDPPFDVGTSHYLRRGEVEVLAYRDTWGGPAYLSMLYPRLSLLRALMKPTATIVVHVGIQVCHHVRVVMDEVFGADNFVNQVAWKRYSAHNDASQGARRLGAVHDVLLFYGMSQTRTWTTLRAPYDKDYVAKWYRHVEPGTGRRFMSSPLTAPGGAAKGNPSYEFLGVRRFWRYGQATMEALHNSGRVYQSRPGAVPRQKHYLDEQEGVPLQDVWTDIRALQGTHVERVGYDTQKPEALLERIVHMCSRPGDLVLDAFSGSGTTAAVAARCSRRWVAIDRSQPAFAVSRRRLRALTRSGEAGPFVVLDALPAMRRALVERAGEAELRRRVLALHGATTWSEGQMNGATTCSEDQLHGAATRSEGQLHGAATRPEGQLHGRRGEAAVVVASPEQRPTAADIAGWLDTARAAGAAALEVIAWTFDPSAHDVDAPAVTLWEIPRALAEGEDGRPTRAPRLSLVVEATPAGRAIRITNYAAVDSDGNWAQLGVDAIVEWALDDRGDAAVFAPRWSTQRGRDGAMPLVSPAIAGEGRVVIEAVDVAGRISTRAID